MIANIFAKFWMAKDVILEFAEPIAKKSLPRLRSLAIWLTIFLIVWSCSFGFSTFVYASLYMLVIPKSTYVHPIWFTTAPPGQSPANKFDHETYLGWDLALLLENIE